MYSNRKNILITSIIVVILFIAAVILYNIRFKYHSNPNFCHSIDLKATQLNPHKVRRIIIEDLKASGKAIAKNKKELNKNYKTSNFNSEFFRDILYNNGTMTYSNAPSFNKFYSVFNRITFKSRKCDKFACFAKKYKTINNLEYKLTNTESSFKYSNGSVLGLRITDTKCKDSRFGINGICGFGYIDVNGRKGPNKLGIDLFDFAIVDMFIYSPKIKTERPNLLKQYKVAPKIVEAYPMDIAQDLCFHGDGRGCLKRAIFLDNDHNFFGFPVFFHIEKPYWLRDTDSIFLAKNGKLVFINDRGFVDLVTTESIKRNLSKIFKFKYYDPKIYNIPKKPFFVIRIGDTTFRWTW